MSCVRVPLTLVLLLPFVVWGCSSSGTRVAFNAPSIWSKPAPRPPKTITQNRRPGFPPQSAARPSLDEEERACLASGAVRGSEDVSVRTSLGGPFSACGAIRPFIIKSSVGGQVALQPPATLRCPMVPAVNRWLRDVVRPAARRYLGQDVTAIKVIASYSCRTRNGQPGARLSEHGRANALDVAAFHLANGETVTVKDGWRGWRGEGRFLRTVHRGGCDVFTTVLGPDADRFHHDHFHFDLARHGRLGTYRVCR
jgi:hypothetical protein